MHHLGALEQGCVTAQWRSDGDNAPLPGSLRAIPSPYGRGHCLLRHRNTIGSSGPAPSEATRWQCGAALSPDRKELLRNTIRRSRATWKPRSVAVTAALERFLIVSL